MEDYVYDSSDDTELLLECALYELKQWNNADCIEIGFGSGRIMLELAESLHTNKVSGSDINKNAYDKLQNKISSLTENIKSKITLSNTPFFDGFNNKKFDFIIFNPPYLPSDSTDKYLSDDERNSLIGGKKGVETTISFIEKSSDHIHPNSIILFIASSRSNISFLDENIIRLGYKYSILKKKSFGFENLYCYKLVPREALKYVLTNNTTIKFLSKGSRSYVFTIDSNKKIVLKQGINDMTSNFQKEFEILGTLQGIIRVPKPFNLLPNLMIMEKIEGLRADKHSERLDIAVFLLDCAMVLDSLLIFKKEFSRPFTNVIVNEKEIVMIDFERAIIGKRGNMNQLCEFLKREKLLDEESANRVRRTNDEFSENFIKNMENSGFNKNMLSNRIEYFKKSYNDIRRTYHKSLIDCLKIGGDYNE